MTYMSYVYVGYIDYFVCTLRAGKLVKVIFGLVSVRGGFGSSGVV